MSGQKIVGKIARIQRGTQFIFEDECWKMLRIVAATIAAIGTMLLLLAYGSFHAMAAGEEYEVIAVGNDGTASKQIIISAENGQDVKYLTVPSDGLYAISTRGSDIEMTLYVYKDDKGAVCETDFVITSKFTDANNVCESVVYLRSGYLYVLSLEKENGGRAIFKVEPRKNIAVIDSAGYTISAGIVASLKFAYVPSEYLQYNPNINQQGEYSIGIPAKDTNVPLLVSVYDSEDKSIPIYCVDYSRRVVLNWGYEAKPAYEEYYGEKCYVYDLLDYKAKLMLTSDDNELISIVDSMQSYGGYASRYFRNTGGDDTELPAASVFDAYKPVESGSLQDGISYVGSSLLLEDVVTIRHYFYIDPAKADVNKLKIRTSNTNRSVVDGEYPIQKSEINGLWFLDVMDLTNGDLGVSYANLDAMFTVCIESGYSENAGDGVSGPMEGYEYKWTLRYGAYSYAYYAVKSDNQKLIDLMKSMYLFSMKCKSYYSSVINHGDDICEHESNSYMYFEEGYHYINCTSCERKERELCSDGESYWDEALQKNCNYALDGYCDYCGHIMSMQIEIKSESEDYNEITKQREICAISGETINVTAELSYGNSDANIESLREGEYGRWQICLSGSEWEDFIPESSNHAVESFELNIEAIQKYYKAALRYAVTRKTYAAGSETVTEYSEPITVLVNDNYMYVESSQKMNWEKTNEWWNAFSVINMYPGSENSGEYSVEWYLSFDGGEYTHCTTGPGCIVSEVTKLVGEQLVYQANITFICDDEVKITVKAEIYRQGVHVCDAVYGMDTYYYCKCGSDDKMVYKYVDNGACGAHWLTCNECNALKGMQEDCYDEDADERCDVCGRISLAGKGVRELISGDYGYDVGAGDFWRCGFMGENYVYIFRISELNAGMYRFYTQFSGSEYEDFEAYLYYGEMSDINENLLKKDDDCQGNIDIQWYFDAGTTYYLVITKKQASTNGFCGYFEKQ